MTGWEYPQHGAMVDDILKLTLSTHNLKDIRARSHIELYGGYAEPLEADLHSEAACRAASTRSTSSTTASSFSSRRRRRAAATADTLHSTQSAPSLGAPGRHVRAASQAATYVPDRLNFTFYDWSRMNLAPNGAGSKERRATATKTEAHNRELREIAGTLRTLNTKTLGRSSNFEGSEELLGQLKALGSRVSALEEVSKGNPLGQSSVATQLSTPSVQTTLPKLFDKCGDNMGIRTFGPGRSSQRRRFAGRPG